MFKDFDTIFNPIMTFDTLRVYNLFADPDDRGNFLLPYAWALGKVFP